MKWLLRIIFVIFLSFAAVVTAGYFMPATQTVERSVEVDAYPEDIFPYLNNLKAYSQWSPLHQLLTNAEFVYGGADQGVGQSLAWQGGSGDFPIGSQEIIQSEPGQFVQLKLNLGGRQASATHAILENDQDPDGPVTVMTRVEVPLGGFPYLQRVRAKLQQAGWERQFDAALLRLKRLSEAERAL